MDKVLNDDNTSIANNEMDDEKTSINPRDAQDDTNDINPNSLGYYRSSELVTTPGTDKIEENSPSGADIASHPYQPKYDVNSPMDKNENSEEGKVAKNNEKIPLENELAIIINENNNIGREIFRMNEENKRLIKLLQSFTTSSNISKEKKKNLEAYITSQAALLNDAKKIFVEEYNKMKSMELEISTLKSNNNYMKRKLKECRENEFRMKLQSSNDKYLLRTVSNVNSKKNYATTSHSSLPILHKYNSTGNVLNSNKTIKFDKDTTVSQKWKHHEDSCNQQ